MDCLGNQESKSAVNAQVTSSMVSPVGNIWADSNSLHSFLANSSLSTPTPYSEVHALPTSSRVIVEVNHRQAHALPSSCQGMAKCNNPEVSASPLSSSSAGLDQTAVAHVMNPFDSQFGCLPPLRNPMAHLKLHVAHAKLCHTPSSGSFSTIGGLSLSGNELCQSYPDGSFSSGNNAAAHTSTWSPGVCAPKASPSRLEFMQSFVNTLLPELKSIHSQSPPISLKEKLSAVRLAADMSLAISAGGNNTWSQALYQELARSSSSKLVARRKKNVRKSHIFRGRSIYTSILRRRALRAGSHAMRLHSRSHTWSPKGSNSFACFSMFRDCSHSTLDLSAKCFHVSRSDLSACLPGGECHKTSSYVCRMRRVRRNRRSGCFSYVKILRQSGPTKKSTSVKLPADQCNEAIQACTPSISKEHIMSLGRLVPGGRNMDVPLLFQEAANYIVSLQMQIEALQSLSHFATL